MDADAYALKARIAALEAENAALRAAHQRDVELLNSATAEMEETMRLLQVLRVSGLVPLRAAGLTRN